MESMKAFLDSLTKEERRTLTIDEINLLRNLSDDLHKEYTNPNFSVDNVALLIRSSMVILKKTLNSDVIIDAKYLLALVKLYNELRLLYERETSELKRYLYSTEKNDIFNEIREYITRLIKSIKICINEEENKMYSDIELDELEAIPEIRVEPVTVNNTNAMQNDLNYKHIEDILKQVPSPLLEEMLRTIRLKRQRENLGLENGYDEERDGYNGW